MERSEPVDLSSVVSRQAQRQDCGTRELLRAVRSWWPFFGKTFGQGEHGVLESCDLFKENSNNFAQLYRLTLK